MREMILCKLGEVVLKGLNRRSFEDKLIGNLRRRTAKCGNFRIYSKQSSIRRSRAARSTSTTPS